MEVELFEDLINATRSLVVVVDAIEGAVCGIHRQPGDIQALAIWWYGGDPGCDTETDVVELAQLLHQSINLPSTGSLRIENRFGVIQDYHRFFGG